MSRSGTPSQWVRRKPAAAVAGGVFLAASMMLGTSVGHATAESPTEILERVCAKFVADPTPDEFTVCAGNDLTGMNLTGVNLAYADFSGANLTGVNLTGVNLTGADLTYADLTSANLNGSSVIPSDVTVLTEADDNAVVTWQEPDLPTGLVFLECDPNSGTLFPIGTTPVVCSVTSELGDGRVTIGRGAFAVTVKLRPTGTLGSSGSLGSSDWNGSNGSFGSHQSAGSHG